MELQNTNGVFSCESVIIIRMNRLKLIRRHLGVTQAALGEAMGLVQGGVAAYEKGRDLPRKRAQRLIEFAASRGCPLSFDHVYGEIPLPPLQPVVAEEVVDA